MYLTANFGWLPAAITQLEEQTKPLTQAVDTFSEAIAKLQAVPGPVGLRVSQKCEFVIQNNPDYAKLSSIAQILRGHRIADCMDSYNALELSSFRFALITSTDVERSFSMLKHTLSDRRHCLTFENFKMILVINCNTDP
ncbi:uncharacterized protein LOC108864082 [Galendromus occidentalis]|uniref:Uncharacterized protein LOC108864082 n=1 Tax=Galendromus occidentalis TaxID=34638 RepID=A0AAJ7L3E5_9ACAR|nr:uncharacterized protein LOC108864082 [Galendromus occidentalis]